MNEKIKIIMVGLQGIQNYKLDIDGIDTYILTN